MIINLGELLCKSLTKDLGQVSRVASLSNWAEGIDIYKINNVMYLPDYGFPIWMSRIVPEESINTANNFNARLGRFTQGHGGPINGPFLELVEPEKLDCDVCILGNVYSHVFTHWCEELLSESLALLGIQPSRFLYIDRPCEFKSVFLNTTISHKNAHRFPNVIKQLRHRLYDATKISQFFYERVWVERGCVANGRHVNVINEDAVETFLKKHEIERVDFGKLPFADQIALDRNISLLIGPHGSAFAHCGFMQDKQKIVDIFSPEYINPYVLQLCIALGHSYQQIVPRRSYHTPYEFGTDLMIDIDHLELAISS